MGVRWCAEGSLPAQVISRNSAAVARIVACNPLPDIARSVHAAAASKPANSARAVLILLPGKPACEVRRWLFARAILGFQESVLAGNAQDRAVGVEQSAQRADRLAGACKCPYRVCPWRMCSSCGAVPPRPRVPMPLPPAPLCRCAAAVACPPPCGDPPTGLMFRFPGSASRPGSTYRIPSALMALSSLL